MATSAIVVNEGRNALITYLRNSQETPQTNKYYIKEFVLLTGITGNALVEKVWNETGMGNDLSQYMIAGELGGTPTSARFNIADRTQEAGEKLRLHCVVPTLYDTLGTLIEGVAVLFYKQDTTVGLWGYVTFDGQNKVTGSDLEIFADIQF